MSRPLFVMLTGLVLGEAAAFAFGKTGVCLIFLPVMAALILLNNNDKKRHMDRRRGMAFLLLFCSFFVGSLNTYQERYPDITEQAVAGSRDDWVLTGRVVSVSYKTEGNAQVVIKNAEAHEKGSANSQRIRGNVLGLVSVQREGEILPSDDLKVTGSFELLLPATNPGEFDARVYYLARGIRLRFTGNQWQLKGRPILSFQRAACLMRLKMRQVYRKLLSEEHAAVLGAMVLGDKTDLTYEQRSVYSRNGAAHLLAVSGLHVSVMGGSLFLLMRKKGFGYLSSCITGAAVLLFYGCITGFGSSAARAVIMYLVYLLSALLGTDYDIISALSLSGILLLFQHPWRILEGGFQISCFSILTLGLILPVAREWKERKAGKEEKKASSDRGRLAACRESLFSGIIFAAVMFPVLLRTFYEFTPLSILLNLILLPCMGPLMISAVCGGIMGICMIKSAGAALVPARVILSLFDTLFAMADRMPFRDIFMGCPKIRQLILIYFAEILIFLLWYSPGFVRKSFLLLFLLFFCVEEYAAGISLFSAARSMGIRPALTVTMLDVGQGECILIQTPDRKSILIDGGSSSRKNIGKYVILPVLTFYGIKRLDYLVATHMDGDHISGIYELLEEKYPVKNVLVPAAGQEDPEWKKFTKAARKAGALVIPVKRGDSVRFHKMNLTCIHPCRGYQPEDRNDTSVVLFLSYLHFDMLFTGDLGEEGEAMLNSYLKKRRSGDSMDGNSLDVLKVAHHGSRYSTSPEFLSLFPDLRTALISAGRDNRYGHPHRELLKRLSVRNISVHETPKEGAVELITDGNYYDIKGFVDYERTQTAN